MMHSCINKIIYSLLSDVCICEFLKDINLKNASAANNFLVLFSFTVISHVRQYYVHNISMYIELKHSFNMFLLRRI